MDRARHVARPLGRGADVVDDLPTDVERELLPPVEHVDHPLVRRVARRIDRPAHQHDAAVRHLTERGIGVLITDHNVRETLGLTDRAYIIYAGEVLREGDAEDIINDPDVRRLYLGEDFSM